MPIRAVLFDVGGPLDSEVQHERQIDADIRAALAEEGLLVSDAASAEASRWAVSVFAWDTYAAIIWRLTNGNVELARRVRARVSERGQGRDVFELRDGVALLLNRLAERGLLLGLAANQPVTTIAKLDHWGIGHLFKHREVSASHGFRKPDPRLFLRACEDLGVMPPDCIMVGDRIDNDIVPARLLDMKTVLFRTGRHIDQQPRDWNELPDIEVRDVAELDRAIKSLTAV